MAIREIAMIDSTVVIVGIESLIAIVVIGGMLLWRDKRQSERFKRMEKRIDDFREEMQRDRRRLKGG
jgi:hypothetical protein